MQRTVRLDSLACGACSRPKRNPPGRRVATRTRKPAPQRTHGSHGASFARTVPMMPCGKKSTSTSSAPPTTNR